jgi:hypothetical protein
MSEHIITKSLIDYRLIAPASLIFSLFTNTNPGYLNPNGLLFVLFPEVMD